MTHAGMSRHHRQILLEAPGKETGVSTYRLFPCCPVWWALASQGYRAFAVWLV